MMLFLAALLTLIGVFAWFRMPLRAWLMLAVAVFALGLLGGGLVGSMSAILSAVMVLILAPLLALLYYAPTWRRKYLAAPLLARVAAAMPTISSTEKTAIAAGTVWWDGELFSGQPRWEVLFDTPKPALTAREQAFIDGPVEQLCALVDDWQVTAELGDLSPAAWSFIKSQGFFGLNIAPEYGGLGFSAHAQSCIVQKLASHSATAAVSVMVPNSLGPAELLHHYGTEGQKQHYLPRLAAGAETPCFALTNPWAGSDAAAMPDAGVVCNAMHDGKPTVGFRVNWEKRYITLGPVATLLGLAFCAYDPDGLLGGETELGITCALVPTDAAGVSIGRRHLPLNAAFQNGPNYGLDVFIPMDWIIGGQARIGQGWRMLMESLAAGRGISLPAAAAGVAKMATRSSGAYARIREQFGLEIGKFEGIEEALARIGGLTYLLDAGAGLMTSALALGEKPAVMSAIVKHQCTALSRIVINDAMDIHGGKGVCLGPANYLARAYQQIPIGITVEGANILTRSLIIFGQGALRCHPHLLAEIEAVALADEDKEAALDKFNAAIALHIAHLMSNKMRATALALSRGTLARGCGRGLVKRHSRSIEHLSAAFAFLADVTLLLLGGELKRREMLSGRFADALGNLYLASAALKKFHDNGAAPAEAPLADWACRYALFQAQSALDGILRNYPKPWLGKLLRVNVFGGGRYLRMPSDALSKQVATLLQTPGAVRDRLTEHCYIAGGGAGEAGGDGGHVDVGDGGHVDVAATAPTAQLEAALRLTRHSASLRRRLKRDGQRPTGAQTYADWLAAAHASGAMSGAEAELLKRTRQAVAAVIRVDDFAAATEPSAGAPTDSRPNAASGGVAGLDSGRNTASGGVAGTDSGANAASAASADSGHNIGLYPHANSAYGGNADANSDENADAAITPRTWASPGT